jgi:cellulose synthase operon protein C
MAQSIQIPPEAVIINVMAVYERGLTLDALRQAEKFAALKYWGGIHSCVLAARIAVNAGAPRLASRLSVRAWRTDKSHSAAQLQFGYQLYELRGPLAARRTMRGWKTDPHVSVEDRAELLALRAYILADLRDFATAEKFVQQAEELCGGKPWIRLQHAYLLERQDRIEEALEIAQAASALHPFPFYRPGAQMAAHLLQLLDRDEEAIQLLKQADAVLQSGLVAGQLYGLLSDNGRWEDADVALLRYIEMSPLLELPLQKWVKLQRVRIAYHLGKGAEAARLARELDDVFHKNFISHLESAHNGAERVQLEVSFVRQHFKTCAPATLAALARFWRMPAEHLKLAEAMCYDGTPSWQQRDWAERNGWFVREFRVTHEIVRALTSAGIPFAISTVDATSAHMQAVVGFARTLTKERAGKMRVWLMLAQALNGRDAMAEKLAGMGHGGLCVEQFQIFKAGDSVAFQLALAPRRATVDVIQPLPRTAAAWPIRRGYQCGSLHYSEMGASRRLVGLAAISGSGRCIVRQRPWRAGTAQACFRPGKRRLRPKHPVHHQGPGGISAGGRGGTYSTI